jgi:hypothetical protein
VADGHLRWVIVDGTQSFGGPGGDTRTGSEQALEIVAKTCKRVTFRSSSGTTVTMYDCQGRAAAMLAAAQQS